MTWREIIDTSLNRFSQSGTASSGASALSWYVEVPAELTIHRLGVKNPASDFHEFHESPFELFSKGEGRTTVHAPSMTLLLGQYGMGKSAFVHQLGVKLRSRGQFPLVLNLADCRQASGSDSVIDGLTEATMVDFLFSSVAAHESDPKAFLEAVRKELIPEIHNGRVILILDSLDELALNRRKLQKFLQTLVGFLMPDNMTGPCGARAVVAVRSEYLAAFGIDDAESLLGDVQLAQFLTFYFLKLSAFTDSRIQRYLTLRQIPNVTDVLSGLPALKDVLVRPLFLRIFCDLADKMHRRDLQPLRSPTGLIQLFIQHASEDARQKIRKPFQWDEHGLATLALELYNTGGLDIPIERVRKELVKPHNVTIDDTWEAIHKCPFLRKSSPTAARFSHRVFVEYFTAKRLAEEGAGDHANERNAFDTIVLDVDTRKFLKDLYGEDWFARTRKSYALDEELGWGNVPAELCLPKGRLEKIRQILLEYMTNPEREDETESVRRIVHEFLELDSHGLHPCYRTYNYEAVAVFLWFNRKDEVDQKLSEHFETQLIQRLDEAKKHLHHGDDLRADYERLVERILSIAERLRYDKLLRFNKKKILEKIEEPDTKARIKHIVAGI